MKATWQQFLLYETPMYMLSYQEENVHFKIKPYLFRIEFLLAIMVYSIFVGQFVKNLQKLIRFSDQKVVCQVPHLKKHIGS